MQIALNWPLHKKNIFCLRHLAVSEVFVNISAESGHETQTSQSSECTTAFLWQFKFWVKSLTVLSLFEWIQQKQGILSGSFSHLLYPPSCDLEISQCLITKSLKMTLGEEERCYWAGVSLTEVCSPIHLCPSNSCWEPIRWWDTRKVRVCDICGFFSYCATLMNVLSISWKQDSKAKVWKFC